MAPRISADLLKRQFGYYDYGYYNSPWNVWGRWVALVAIVFFVLLCAFAYSCVNARRRRRAGLAPRYGTGWTLGKTPYGHNAPQYNGYQGQYGGSAPPYTPNVNANYTGNTFNNNEGYYGQQSGIELQQPPHAYMHGGPVYPQSEGPPPSKMRNDGYIR